MDQSHNPQVSASIANLVKSDIRDGALLAYRGLTLKHERIIQFNFHLGHPSIFNHKTIMFSNLLDIKNLPVDQLSTEVIAGLVTLPLVTFITFTFYRLFFHPLAAIPGPMIAALSPYWLYYICRTTFPEKALKELHGKYKSKALRIAPNEVHISDPSIYKIIYSQTAPYSKTDDFYQCFSNPHSLTSEADPGLHRERRRTLNPYFSKKAVDDLCPLVWTKVEKLEKKLRGIRGTFDAYDAVRCLTVEIITKFAFGRDIDISEGSDSFDAEFLDTFDAAAHGIVDMVFMPTFNRLKFLLPMPILIKLDKKMASLLKFGDWAQDCLTNWSRTAKVEDKAQYPVIFECLTHLPDVSKKAQAIDILAAGSDTTALTLTFGLFHILSNPKVKAKLVQELKEALLVIHEAPTVSALEKLPYLTGCMKESLRMASPVPGRLPRVVPAGKAPLVVDGKIIPPGTIVGMSAWGMHHDTEIWGQDVEQFRPERWVEDDGKTLDQFLCPFSKGQRSCIGQNLAMAEVRLVLAMLFRRFDLDLAPSATISEAHDCFTIQLDRPGLLITCTPKEE
ncbi:hypothetical protein ACKAV7_013100 [Fusarium commune]